MPPIAIAIARIHLRSRMMAYPLPREVKAWIKRNEKKKKKEDYGVRALTGDDGCGGISGTPAPVLAGRRSAEATRDS
uniref:Uncharacterized protein n=1 Tax=Oryza sativa subsp. japonica TaxID=39947 RepID=Q5Z8V6_ORYSJ|nr:hypothetical protein [Oryza sativa Japonica Group]